MSLFTLLSSLTESNQKPAEVGLVGIKRRRSIFLSSVGFCSEHLAIVNPRWFPLPERESPAGAGLSWYPEWFKELRTTARPCHIGS